LSRPDPLQDDDQVARWLRDLPPAGTTGPAPDSDAPPLTDEAVARILAKAEGRLPVGQPPRFLPKIDAPGTAPAAPPAVKAGRRALVGRGISAASRFLRVGLAAAALVLLLNGAASFLDRVNLWIEGPDGPGRRIVLNPGERVVVVKDGEPAGAVTAPPADRVWVVDDSDPGYSESGDGWRPGSLPGGFQGTYRYNARTANFARWGFEKIPPGRFSLYATWIPHENRATHVPFTVKEGERPLGRVMVHQNVPPADLDRDGARWCRLGTFVSTGGPIVVEMDPREAHVDHSAKVGNSCIADAVMIVTPAAPGTARGPADIEK